MAATCFVIDETIYASQLLFGFQKSLFDAACLIIDEITFLGPRVLSVSFAQLDR